MPLGEFQQTVHFIWDSRAFIANSLLCSRLGEELAASTWEDWGIQSKTKRTVAFVLNV